HAFGVAPARHGREPRVRHPEAYDDALGHVLGLHANALLQRGELVLHVGRLAVLARSPLELAELGLDVLILFGLAERGLDLVHRGALSFAILDLLFHPLEVVERARSALRAEDLGAAAGARLLGTRQDRAFSHLELFELLLHSLELFFHLERLIALVDARLL